jgi:hypothetical protein
VPARLIDVLKPEQKAALGYVKDALKDVRKELKELQKDALKTMTQGGTVERPRQERLSYLQDQEDTLAGQLKGDTKAKAVVEAAAEKSSLKVVADVMKGGNPHGKFRQALSTSFRSLISGRPLEPLTHAAESIGMRLIARGYTGMGTALVRGGAQVSAALASPVVAGIAGVGGAAVHFGAQRMQNAAEAQLTTAKSNMESSTSGFNLAHSLRYDTSGTANRDIQLSRLARRTENVERNAAFAALDWYDPNTVAQIGSLRRSHATSLDAMRRTDTYIDAGALTRAGNLDAARNSNEVQRVFSWKEKGIFGWLQSQTWDRAWGTRDLEAEQAAVKVAQGRVEALRKQMEDRENEWNADPVNQINALDQRRQLNAVFEDRFSRYLQWNSY